MNILKFSSKTQKFLITSVQVFTFALLVGLLFFVSWIKWIWVALVFWAIWRFVLRLIIFGYDLCYKCGRIKKLSAMSEERLQGGSICKTCMNRHAQLENSIAKIETTLESIAEMSRLRKCEDEMKRNYESRKHLLPPPKDADEIEHV